MGAEEESREVNQRSGPNPSPNPHLTESQFLSWKRQKDADASARKAEAARKRAEDIAAGIVQMNDFNAVTRHLGSFLGSTTLHSCCLISTGLGGMLHDIFFSPFLAGLW
ncbi:hypothetical protein Vadar_025267 [Vaccinium darrowii]|uniref:Uncharacterized protein n=1 Tax=Vaccinium darrowii TaxID=229202 RepID=A0ACB7Y8X9_9ERIC|nr:hypothetical protein Vadar_025267 [Vaccinium darrowii]